MGFTIIRRSSLLSQQVFQQFVSSNISPSNPSNSSLSNSPSNFSPFPNNRPCNKHQRYFLDVEMRLITRLGIKGLMEMYSRMLGREVKSLQELSNVEASRLIKKLRERYR